MSGAAILAWSIFAAQAMLALAMALNCWRVIAGPRAQDRVLGLDAMYLNAMLLVVTIGVRTGATLYFEVALAIAILGFVSSVALAKFLMRGEVIE